MSDRSLLLAAFLLLVPVVAAAQSIGLRGRFVDATSHAPVPGVRVKLVSAADTSDIHRVDAKDDGSFAIGGLGVHSYRLEATRMGYATLRMIVRVTRHDQDAGAIALTPKPLLIPGVTTRESPPPAVVNADTTEYQAAAVKINKDATAEDLVQKLPGVTMENGQIKAHGENVQQVLVNGRPFFGNDPTAAMRNLPAEVVDRIQVYDRMSDQAELTGFDDGQSLKTMNFILRDRKATFGKLYSGGGDRDLYQAGGNLSALRGGTRFTLIGMSNNINQMNFSPQDLFGGMSGGGDRGGGPRMMIFGGGRAGFRPGGGGGGNIVRMGGPGGGFDPGNFFVGQQPGLTTTSSGGLNYVGQWGSRLAASWSMFANGTHNDDVQSLARQYLPPQNSIALYDQTASSDARTGNLRFDGRFEWSPDSADMVIVQPRLYFQNSDATTSGGAANAMLDGTPLSRAINRTGETVDGDNLSGRMTLRRRFGRGGSNLTADLNAGSNRRATDGSQRGVTDAFEGGAVTSDTLDEQSNSRTLTRSYSARIAFTQPVASWLKLQAIYNPSLSRSAADARTLGLTAATGAYTTLDSALSNSYVNRVTAQNGGLAALLTRGIWKLLVNGSVQTMRLRSEQTWPFPGALERSYGDVLPSAQLTASFANRRNLRLAWNTSAKAPSVGQLQNVVNNSNPLALTTGNPSLRPTYSQTLSLRLMDADPMHSRSRFLFANVTRTSHTIANATFTAIRDTVLEGVALARGTQLTRPENLDESWNGDLFGVYSRPAAWLKSIVSLNGGGSFTRTPTQLDDVVNVGSTCAVRAGVVVASNISPNLDFTVSYTGAYNIRRNTQSATGATGDYFSHTAGLRFSATLPGRVVIRQELNNNYQSGVAADGRNEVLWTTTLGQKFLANDRAEFRLTATDVLAQDRSLNRSITETYVQDTRDQVLGRFVQAVFTYSFR
ncbi:MAG TPA: TonB-dependent receptor [Terriglobales bacterium]|nr:TonB-dependent receptor [Terriglobales bacterium]